MSIASRAVRNIGRRKGRILLAVIAIGVAMAIMISIPAGLSASQSAMEHLSDRMTIDYAAQAAEIENTSTLIEVGNTGSSSTLQGPGMQGGQESTSATTINDTVITTLEALDGVEAVVPYISRSEGMPDRDDFFREAPPDLGAGGAPPTNGTMPDLNEMRDMLSDVVKVLGVSLTEDHISEYSVLPATILEGRELQVNETGSVLLTRNLTAYYDVEVGGIITILDTEFTVVGTYENTTSMGNRTVFMSIADAQEIYNMGSNVSYLYVYTEDSSMVNTIASAIELAYEDIAVSTISDRLQQLTRLQEMSEQTLTSASSTVEQTENTALQLMIIAVAATAMIVLFVMLYTVKERTKEIGVLKTLGFSKRAVIAQFILEGVIVTALAGILGAVIGWAGTSTLASLVLPSSSSTGMGGDAQQAASLSIQPDPAWVIMAFLLVICLGAIGSLYPAWRASRTRPVEALKND